MTVNGWGLQSGSSAYQGHVMCVYHDSGREVYTGNQRQNHTHKTNVTPEGTVDSKGANYSVATLPNYKNVYMWERTS